MFVTPSVCSRWPSVTIAVMSEAPATLILPAVRKPRCQANSHGMAGPRTSWAHLPSSRACACLSPCRPPGTRAPGRASGSSGCAAGASPGSGAPNSLQRSCRRTLRNRGGSSQRVLAAPRKLRSLSWSSRSSQLLETRAGLHRLSGLATRVPTRESVHLTPTQPGRARRR